MKLIHLSDLHLGKRVNEFSMIEDQKYILNEILRIIDKEAPDGVLLAGDLYDRPIPSAEAVQLFDRFLTQLAERKIPVYAISGNHDSAERIAFGSQIMSSSGICMPPVRQLGGTGWKEKKRWMRSVPTRRPCRRQLHIWRLINVIAMY